MPTSRVRNLTIVLLCSVPVASRAQVVRAAPTPAAAVEEFMRAVADSNLTRMAQLFGNAKGAAARTHQPKDYEKRMVIIQALLHGVQAQALGDVPSSKSGMRSVTSRLSHNGCRVTITVNAVKAQEGWLVHDFDAVEASRINQPCDTGKPGGNSPE